jgi:hypothetical protein
MVALAPAHVPNPALVREAKASLIRDTSFLVTLWAPDPTALCRLDRVPLGTGRVAYSGVPSDVIAYVAHLRAEQPDTWLFDVRDACWTRATFVVADEREV